MTVSRLNDAAADPEGRQLHRKRSTSVEPVLRMADARFGPGTSGTFEGLEHTDPELVQPITNHVEHLFEELMGSLPAEDQAIRQLGEIHWWMAHAMPDTRGSAVKTELCIRAIAGAMGMECRRSNTA